MLRDRSTLQQIRQYLHQELRRLYPDNESVSIASLIMEHSGFPSPVYLKKPELIPDSSTIAQINEIVSDIHTYKPIQYILGHTLFCDLKILVNENVLIPRPETEEMIYKIFDSNTAAPKAILDIGTGSGCMALALKHKYPSSSVFGLDISREALKLAAENSRLTQLDIELLEGDILRGTPADMNTGFDLIVSNPPYVLKSERAQMEANVLNFEPASALFVEDQNPLLFYNAIARFCRDRLNPGGVLWVEINEQFGSELVSILEDYPMEKIILHKDIHEKERFIEARKR